MTRLRKLPSRTFVGFICLLFLAALVTIDLAQSRPIDPYQAPYPTALGSGQIPSGAHCTDISGLD